MEDRAAIAKCLEGDPGAFRHLVERYQAQAQGHALGILACRDLARDAVQEAFLDAWRNLRHFDQTRRFYPWLYTLVRNRCFKLLSARRVAPEAAALPVAVSSGEERPDLIKGLAALSPEDRELILQKHLDGLSYAELAARLGIPPGTVMSRLYHARRRLMESLGGGQKEAP